ncbi:tRNA pseudouridine(38-40) synthase TruA [Ethanoligenens harbinense]|uniref:tRNA pseudouridine synthase A n=1 Tax=Ethanoligenens harbinense (strain DSM 18485 / JCM 12961 / CGMCC 1.5033 / YUAN-3) TaxID=663278 RepID=E6U473_ETHHY|nr:tRNA pseudouridine(38-40) synthase TruA [Ethanoligenens harbinense]ADU26573.1 tRNA pseudouridine synthase A [Ethanoligenens harbinense YUAN-3]AVQ95699.1 tRNA pseudouridine(38-40) synthase TruA [Ethanoligenens harbinense YUAN-3]AYF38362.1 tRNA pseudouridine(38-40) synthase TruA [Ethanoligenens harbinense]AYF41107.1 tRNA pseudouridine(38-40) synthase TruA [Ethanoligenens harbinense]QCN91938.1 tRNA pseudouridine(38-40) synthase TruA [Ethanoligenens harbinense]
MRNILLLLRFDGAAYHGWQVQKNGVTVQEVLQNALETVLRHRPPVTGCSRTDAGVHALAYACNFRTEHTIPCQNLVRALNACLPDDIAVFACREVPPDFHARYSAHEKEYVYRILNAPARDPFWRGRALHVPYPLDEAVMDKAARGFLGTHDFAGFRAAGSDVKDTVRTVFHSGVQRDGDLVLFRVRADGFLYNMVRIMVGTLLYTAQDKLQPADILAVIDSRDRTAAGPTAPAHGLYLNRVFYDETGWPAE